jgi:hypothetical protein
MVMLWDLDNLSTGRHDVPELAAFLAHLGGPGMPRIAAGHFVTCRALAAEVSAAGFDVRSGGRRPHGADRVLLRQARRHAKGGWTYFLVGSSDGAFARVSHLGHLVVLSLDETRVSRRLWKAADAVIVLVRTVSGWRMRYAQPPAAAGDRPA